MAPPRETIELSPAEGRPVASGISDALFWGSLFQGIGSSWSVFAAANPPVDLFRDRRGPPGAWRADAIEPRTGDAVEGISQHCGDCVRATGRPEFPGGPASAAASMWRACLKHLGMQRDVRPAPDETGAARWMERFAVKPSANRNIVKPLNWQDYPYPFIFGQFDPTLFPTNDWRESARAALSVPESTIGHAISSMRTIRH